MPAGEEPGSEPQCTGAYGEEKPSMASLLFVLEDCAFISVTD